MIYVNGKPYEPQPGDGRRLIEAAVEIEDQKLEGLYTSVVDKLTRAVQRTSTETQPCAHAQADTPAHPCPYRVQNHADATACQCCDACTAICVAYA